MAALATSVPAASPPMQLQACKSFGRPTASSLSPARFRRAPHTRVSSRLARSGGVLAPRHPTLTRSNGLQVGEGETAPPTVSSLKDSLAALDAFLQPSEGNPAKARDEGAAVQLMSDLKDSGVVRGFGAAHQVPKRNYTLEELRLNKIFPEKLLSPEDKTVNKINDRLKIAAVAGLAALSYAQHWDAGQALGASVFILLGLTIDQVAAGGGVSGLLLDTIARATSSTYKNRVAAHEAGHFLVAYLLGLLPQAYTLSSLEAYQRYKAFNVQAGTVFCDSEFQSEVAGGTMSSTTLGRYTCVALAGVATEYLQFGVAEGGMGDVQQLDGLLRALNFTQAKADGEIRWAVLNVIALLRRHTATHKALTAAMLGGCSVADCVVVIEESLAKTDDI